MFNVMTYHFLRNENHSPFGEIRRFETKIGDLRESCRFDEKIFMGWGVGSEAGQFIVLRKVLYLDTESLSENLSVVYVRIQYFLTISRRNRDGKGCDWSSNKIMLRVKTAKFCRVHVWADLE